MSSPVDTKKLETNIKNAFVVVRKTYENLHKLFQELDAVAGEEGLIPLTPEFFLRYRSDNDPQYGWMI